MLARSAGLAFITIAVAALPRELGASPMPPPEIWLSLVDEGNPLSVAPPWIGEKTLYLWTSSPAYSAQVVEFSFECVALQVVDLVPRAGVVNLGSLDAPLLHYDECRFGFGSSSAVIAEVIVRDAAGAGGTMCFSHSGPTHRNCQLLCDRPRYFAQYFTGFASDGSDPCGGSGYGADCEEVVAAESTTWGTVRVHFK